MDVATFSGQTLSVAGVTAAVTQIFKVADGVTPRLAKIPVVGSGLAWLVDTITPDDELAIHIFAAAMCLGLNLLATYMQTGAMQIDLATAGQTLVSFMEANGAYALLLKRYNVEQPQ